MGPYPGHTNESRPLLGYSREKLPLYRRDTRSREAPSAMSKGVYTFATIFFLAGLSGLLYLQARGKSRHMILPEDTMLEVKSPSDKYFDEINNPHPPSDLWGNVKRPYPTGAFWTNFVVDDGSGPVGVLPYGVKCLSSGVQVSYGPTRREVSSQFMRDIFACDLEISATDEYTKHFVNSFDELSVKMKFLFKGGSMVLPLIKGSPYITAIFKDTQPVIRASTMKIVNVEVRNISMSSPNKWFFNLFGTQSILVRHYIISLGNFQKWVVFFYSSDNDLCSKQFFHWDKESNSLIGKHIPKGQSGYVRIAFLPPQQVESALAVLLKHSVVIPVGGSANISCTDEEETCGNTRVSYKYIVENLTFFTRPQVPPLLMLALPHHIRDKAVYLPSSRGAPYLTCSLDKTVFSATDVAQCLAPIYSLKGKMTAVLGSEWSVTYATRTANWMYDVDADHPIPTYRLSAIGQSLVDESAVTYLNGAEDPYTVGKALARLSMLALIADNLGVAPAREKALQSIQTEIVKWIAGTNKDRLLFDATYGGVVTHDGILDPQADFGSGLYNDHHFHFGYFMYTGAVLARLSPAFFSPYQRFFDALSKDICNPDKQDVNFPFARHKDSFDWHSWASGLFQQANGKNQESSSEAVNAYYSVALYADATKDLKLKHFAQSMMTMEIEASQRYWHASGTEVYDQLFGESIGMVGNVGAFDATSSTWFGSNVEYIYGINTLPLSPITLELFSDWEQLREQLQVIVGPSLQEEMAEKGHGQDGNCKSAKNCVSLGLHGLCCPTQEGVYLSCCSPAAENNRSLSRQAVAEEWTAIMFALYALLDPEQSWQGLTSIKNFGLGNSMANSLLWAASLNPKEHSSTRFSEHQNAIMKPLKPDKDCASNSACDAMGVQGACCPADGGEFLACCPKS